MYIVHEEHMRMRTVDREKRPMKLVRLAVGLGEPQGEEIEAVFMPIHQKQEPIPELIIIRVPRSKRPQKILRLRSGRPERTHRREIPVLVMLEERTDVNVGSARVQPKQD